VWGAVSLAALLAAACAPKTGTAAPGKNVAEVPSAKPVGRAGGQPHTDGRLPPEVIQRIIRAHYDEFRFCYEKGLAKDSTLKGKVVARFVIERDGHVDHVKDAGSTLPDKDAIACVFAGYQKLLFPKPDGGIVTVVYPIMFSPSE
jgi:hypothetical protein